MSKYELLLVLPGTLDDAQAKTRSEEVVEMVKAHGSDVELHPIGKNRLAYPIKHIRYGYFYTIVFTSTVEEIKKLEEQIALTRDLLRTLITHFNTTLTATQRIVYSTDNLGLTTMVERPAASHAPTPVAMPDLVRTTVSDAAKVESPVERKLDETSIAEISKKLDDIMGGDVLPNI